MSNSNIGLFIFGSILFVMGIIFLLLAVMLAFFEKQGSRFSVISGIVSLLFAVVLWLMSEGKLNELALEVMGLKAQVRRTEETIKQANATIEQLRDLGLTYAEPSFINLAMSGNIMVGMTGDTKVEMREKLAASLRKLGISDAQIDTAAKDFDEMFNGYHRGKFMASLPPATKANLPQENMTPETVRARGLNLSPESEEFLKDWEYFRIHKKLRRPELWREHLAGTGD